MRLMTVSQKERTCVAVSLSPAKHTQSPSHFLPQSPIVASFGSAETVSAEGRMADRRQSRRACGCRCHFALFLLIIFTLLSIACFIASLVVFFKKMQSARFLTPRSMTEGLMHPALAFGICSAAAFALNFFVRPFGATIRQHPRQSRGGGRLHRRQDTQDSRV